MPPRLLAAARAAACSFPPPRHGGRCASGAAVVVAAPPPLSAAPPPCRCGCLPVVDGARRSSLPPPPYWCPFPSTPSPLFPVPAVAVATDLPTHETGFAPFSPSWRWRNRLRRHPDCCRGRPLQCAVADASSRRRWWSVPPHPAPSLGLPPPLCRRWCRPLLGSSPNPVAVVTPVLTRRARRRHPPPFPSCRTFPSSLRLFRQRCC